MGDPRFNSAWTYCGTPVVTIPCRLSESRLPIGLQMVGPHGSEEQLLAAAGWSKTSCTRSATHDSLRELDCPIIERWCRWNRNTGGRT